MPPSSSNLSHPGFSKSSSGSTAVLRLKKILGGIGILILVACVVGLFLPGSYRVERNAWMRAQPGVVYAQISDFKKWPEWSAWNTQRYPDMKVNYSGSDSGAGSVYSWEGKSSGQGTMKLTSVQPDKLIVYSLDFDNGKFVSEGRISITPEADQVRVTWVNEGQLGKNPINRWFGLMMDSMMGPDFQTGLEKLKGIVESSKP